MESWQWRADQIVCLDESAFNERTGHRKYGWAPRGTKANTHLILKRSERWSVLPAYTIDGYISAIVKQGSITKEDFVDFVTNHVLPKCNPWPGPRSLLLMDNCSTHAANILEPLCQAAGVRLRFLPLYTPWLNPIEGSFHDQKVYTRRYYAKTISEYKDFESWLIALFHIRGRGPVAAKRARHHFRNSGYNVEDSDNEDVDT